MALHVGTGKGPGHQNRLPQGVGGPVVLQNVSVRVGDHTNLNSGSVFLKNLGLKTAGSGPILTWTTGAATAIGGGASGDLGALVTGVANATARSPKPTAGDNSNLTKTLNATSYTIPVSAVGVDGSTASCTLTYVVVANAFNLGDDPVRDGNAAWVPAGMGTATGGLTMLLSTGAGYTAVAYAPSGTLDIAGFLPTAGRTTVQYADAARPSQIYGFRIIDCKAMTVDGLKLGGAKVNKSQLVNSSSICDDIIIQNCTSPYATYATDIEVGNASTHSAFVSHSATNVTFRNNSISWVGRAIDVSLGSNVIIDGNEIRYCFGDGGGIGDTPDCQFINNTICSPMRDPFDTSGTPDHVDCLQLSNSVSITRPIIKGNVWAQADGNCGWGGLQNGSDGVIDGLYANNIVLGHATTGLAIGTCMTTTFRDSTIFFSGSGKVNNSSLNANDNLTNGAFQVSIQTDIVDPTAHDNFMSRLFTSGSISSATTHWTFTNNDGPNVTYPNTVQFPLAGDPGGYDPVLRPNNYNYEPDMGGSTFDWSTRLNYADALERLNNYNASTNPNGTDYPNMTVAQIKARVLTILTPKTGGLLDLGGGSTIGAVKLDGTLKTDPSSVTFDATTPKWDATTTTWDHT